MRNSRGTAQHRKTALGENSYNGFKKRGAKQKQSKRENMERGNDPSRCSLFRRFSLCSQRRKPERLKEALKRRPPRRMTEVLRPPQRAGSPSSFSIFDNTIRLCWIKFSTLTVQEFVRNALDSKPNIIDRLCCIQNRVHGIRLKITTCYAWYNVRYASLCRTIIVMFKGESSLASIYLGSIRRKPRKDCPFQQTSNRVYVDLIKHKKSHQILNRKRFTRRTIKK